MKGFKDFVMRGNVVDLAVAVVIGTAFGLLITAFLDGLINPLIAALFGQPNLDSVGTFTINNAHFSIGVVLTQIIAFLSVAAAVYFVVVLPMNKLKARSAKEEPAAGPSEVELLTEIRDALKAQNG